MGRMACTEPQCLYKGDLYLFTLYHIVEYARNILAVNQSLSQAFTITELRAVKLNLSFCSLFEWGDRVLTRKTVISMSVDCPDLTSCDKLSG